MWTQKQRPAAVMLCCALVASCGSSSLRVLEALHGEVKAGDSLHAVVSRVADLHQSHSQNWLYVRAYVGPENERSLLWGTNEHPGPDEIARFEEEACRNGTVQFAFRAGGVVRLFDVRVSSDCIVSAVSPLQSRGA